MNVKHSEIVVVNHDEVCLVYVFKSWFAMLCQWMWIMVCYAEALGCESWYAMLYQWSWIMHIYSQPVVVNHGELYWASGWKSCCDMLNQNSGWESWRVMLCQCFMNHVVKCLANSCKSWRIMLCHWLCIMLYYAEQVVLNHHVNAMPEGVNHGLLCWAGCVGIMVCPLFWITVWYAEPGVWESWCVMMSQWLGITVWMLYQWGWFMVS